MSDIRQVVETQLSDSIGYIATLDVMLNTILDLDLDISKLNETNSVIYNNAADLVYSAVDDKGKSLYSNQEKRDLAIQSHLSTNTEYKTNQRLITEKQTEKKRLDIKVEILKSRISINKYSINFYSNLISNKQ